MVEWSWIRAAMDLGEKVGGWNFGEEELSPVLRGIVR
jgi:hypothetical protein